MCTNIPLGILAQAQGLEVIILDFILRFDNIYYVSTILPLKYGAFLRSSCDSSALNFNTISLGKLPLIEV